MQERLAEFSVLTGASLVKVWSSNVTHVIAGTDGQGAARRTLKYLMAILEGKWIVQADCKSSVLHFPCLKSLGNGSSLCGLVL
jgi:hypothetical protein